MAIQFGSGAVLDEQGTVMPVTGTSATPAAAPVSPPAPGEPPPEPVPVPEVPPAAPEEPAAPAGEEEEDEALVLPPTTRSQRRFVRNLLRENAQYQQQLPALQQQVATLTQLLQQLQTQPIPAAPVPSLPPTPPAPPAAPAGPPPRAEQFTTTEEYVQAMATYTAQNAVQQVLQQRDAEAKARLETEQRSAEDARQQERARVWQLKLAEGRQQFPNFDLAINDPRSALSNTVKHLVLETVLESVQGPAILHYLGMHPDVVAHLNSLSPLGATRFLGALEASLYTPPPGTAEAPPPAPARPAPPPPVVPVASSPPLPLQPVGSGQPPAPPSVFRPGMELRAYEAMRESQMRRR